MDAQHLMYIPSFVYPFCLLLLGKPIPSLVCLTLVFDMEIYSIKFVMEIAVCKTGKGGYDSYFRFLKSRDQIK